MRIVIPAATLQARHPEAFEQVREKMIASRSKTPIAPDPFDWEWSYDMAERIEAMSFTQMLASAQQSRKVEARPTGRALLEAKVDAMFISLEAKSGRRSASVPFDNALLLQGPDTGLPLEVLGVFPKPEGVAAWVWSEPGKDEKAAWRECVLMTALDTPHGVLVRVQGSDRADIACLMDPATGKGRQLADYCPPFTQKQARQINKAFETGATPDGMQTLSEDDLMARFGQQYGRICLDARSASISELLGALSGPGFMAFGATPEDQEAPEPQKGPWISWEGIETATLASASPSRPRI